MENKSQLHKLISIIYRQSNRFFDKELAGTMVGCGQHFFLVRIDENPGVTVLDLARMGYFDKGTVTKAVQKLVEQEYIRKEPDARDRRIQHLYTLEKARPIVDEVYRTRDKWREVLTGNMTPEEIDQATFLLSKMAENAYDYMKDRKVE